MTIEAFVFRALTMRIVTEHGLRFLNQPVRCATDVARGYMQKLAAQPLGQHGGVFHAIHIRGKGEVQGRKELHKPRAIDYGAQSAGQVVQGRRAETAVRLTDVARPHGDPFTHKAAAASLGDSFYDLRQRG